MSVITLEAKLRLYGLLLAEKEPSEQEVNIMYHLALDLEVSEEIGRRLKGIMAGCPHGHADSDDCPDCRH